MSNSKNILDRIVEQKRLEVARLPSGEITAEQVAEVRQRHGPRDFWQSLHAPHRGDVGLIAEVKKASPSAGLICADFDPVRIAKTFESAGADCLSVLTDEKFFGGSAAYLQAIRAVTKLPLLRKDFIIDERQILESAELGADAILLIVAILTDSQLGRFHDVASRAGLTVLVEAHDEIEIDRALAAGARLVGINNRDLRTFAVDLGTTERLAARVRTSGVPWETLLVAESGIKRREDVVRLSKSGARAILVGESLTREKDMAGKVGELLGANPSDFAA
jgi:indole-3-glycerol phosphate synthase